METITITITPEALQTIWDGLSECLGCQVVMLDYEIASEDKESQLCTDCEAKAS